MGLQVLKKVASVSLAFETQKWIMGDFKRTVKN